MSDIQPTDIDDKAKLDRIDQKNELHRLRDAYLKERELLGLPEAEPVMCSLIRYGCNQIDNIEKNI